MPRAALLSLITLSLASAHHAAAQGQFNPAPGGGAPKGNTGEVLFWSAVLLAVAFVMGLAFWIIRKKLTPGGDDNDAGGLSLGFTLADLRQMHAEGQMTDEEFEYAKRKMAAKAKAQLDGAEADGESEDQPIVEDLGDISATAPSDAHSSTDDPQSDADKDDGSGDDPGGDPDKIGDR